MTEGRSIACRIGSAAAVWVACVSGALAGRGDAKPTSSRPESTVQQATHTYETPLVMRVYEPEIYLRPSKYYGPWEPTEVFGRDARCAPSPFAPRGYGVPKKLAPFRMDYAPYRVRDCGLGSVHGPAYTSRWHREPCCDPLFGGCRECDVAVDPQ